MIQEARKPGEGLPMNEKKELIEATCPECRGPLSEVRYNGLTEVRCLVGHAYSPKSLIEAHSETAERALWSAVVALEETERLVEAVAEKFPPEIAKRLREQAAVKVAQADELRQILNRLEAFQTE